MSVRFSNGWVLRDTDDLWESFCEDTRRGDLFLGQFTDEISDQRPDWSRRLAEALRRGLQDDDDDLRDAALASVSNVRPFIDFADDLNRLLDARRDWVLEGDSRAGVPVFRQFISAVANHIESSAIDGLIETLESLESTKVPREELLQRIGWIRTNVANRIAYLSSLTPSGEDADGGDSAPAPDDSVQAPAVPDTVVLSAPVWVDALRLPSGPPAQLFSRLRERGTRVLVSDGLIDEVTDALTRLGWDPTSSGDAAQRMRELGTVIGGDASDIELAIGASIDRVFAVGPRSGTSEQGIEIRPVHELLSVM